MIFSILFIILGGFSILYYSIIWWMSFAKFWLVLGLCFFGLALYLYLRNNNFIKINKSLRITISLIVIVTFSTFLIFEALIISKNINNKMEKNDYVIVLGAGLRGSTMSTMLRYRMEKSLEYLELYPNTKVIVSGGQGPDEDIPEAEAMKDFLVMRGITEENIIMEDKSTNTMENLIYSKEIIEKDENYENKQISLITNGFHVFRAEFLAKRVGLELKGMPARSYIYAIPNFYVREYFAFIKSFVFDKI